jgi:hypothetical protein
MTTIMAAPASGVKDPNIPEYRERWAGAVAKVRRLALFYVKSEKCVLIDIAMSLCYYESCKRR